jgi:hypothetical protein
MNPTTTIGRMTFDKPSNEWAAYVLDCIREKPLAEAGKELMTLATYALETEQHGPFIADLHICLVAYWVKCRNEIDAERVWEEGL